MLKSIPYYLFCLILLGCSKNSSETADSPKDSTMISASSVQNDPVDKINESTTESFQLDTFPVDTALDSYIKGLTLNDKYIVSTIHEPYQLIGYFNDDNFIDTAIIVRNKQNNKDGLLIKHGGGNDFEIIGAGEEVLSQGFKDLNWIGVFYKINKGEKISSNIDEKTGEILTEDIPDSLKVTLHSEGIYVHVSEACGGGIIYWDNGQYTGYSKNNIIT